MHLPPPRFARNQGVALVLTLWITVLLTFLIIAYFSRSILDRRISDTRAGQLRAENVANSAIQIIVADLKQEIAAGSLISSTNGSSTYSPAFAAASVPAPAGTPAGSPNPLPNLVKRSAFNIPFFSGTNYNTAFPASKTASDLKTDQSGLSLFNNTVSAKRWNRPLLLPRKNPAVANDNTPVDAFVPPDWVFVGKQGPAVLASATTEIVGRYAYTVYNVGNLLDINVAGNPASLDLSANGYSNLAVRSGKSSLPLADLTAIPGITTTQTEAIVAGWRNKQSAASAQKYADHLFSGGPRTGFIQVSPGDRTLLGRQDLINYWNNEKLDIAALQYLTPFTRELSAPSFVPSSSRPKVGDSGLANDNAATRTATFGKDDAFNPALPHLRWPVDATLYAGTSEEITVKRGIPYLGKRFNLNRIALLAGTSDADILRYFGLARDKSPGSPTYGGWVYNHGASGKILTLPDLLGKIEKGEIPPREPDFFELLQAGIIQGSLGRDAGLTTPQNTTKFTANFNAEQNTYLHILRIGASIIDQYDADSYPTEIVLPGVTSVYGLESLPYLNKVHMYVGAIDNVNIGGWYVFEVWNPHRPSPLPLTNVPTQFRIVAEGGATVTAQMFYTSGASRLTKPRETSDPMIFTKGDPSTGDDPSASIAFDTSQSNFQDPLVLDYNLTSVTVTQQSAPLNASGKVRGLYVGTVKGNPQVAGGDPQGTVSKGIAPSLAISFFLQYYHPTYGWKTYDVMGNLVRAVNVTDATSIDILGGGSDQRYQLNPEWMYWRPDPRTDRFGCGLTAVAGDATFKKESKNISMRPRLGYWDYATFDSTQAKPDAKSGFLCVPADNNWRAASYALNARQDPGRTVTAGKGEPPLLYYSDPDGVIRMGDSAYTNASDIEGHPMLSATNAASIINRSAILNRPFRSVGELGYTYRDVPWKTLDFFTANSGDAPLLDLFTVSEDAATVAAGKLNINTPHAHILVSVLRNALVNESAAPAASSDLLDDATAQKIAAKIVQESQSAPFINRNDLVTRLATGLGNDQEVYPTLAATRIKGRREAMVRALANVANTRTWNLMIDVIAQSGKFPPKASSLNQFQIAGEKRYWIHLAIDRYTGEVIDKMIEPVYE